MRRTITFIGKLLFWTTLAVALLGAGALLLITQHLDEAVRAEVQRVFGEHYEGLHVAVRSAHRVEGQGLFVRGLSIKDPSLEGPQSELLYVDEMFVECHNSLDELALGNMQFDHIALRRMAVRAVRRADGSWSVARLVPLPSFGDGLPTASIEDGTVEIFDPQRNPPASLTLRRINVEVQPQRGRESFSRSSPDEAAALAGGEKDSRPLPRDVLAVTGTLGSGIFDKLEMTGWLDPADGRWHVRGKVEQLVVAPETRQALPASIAQHIAALGNLRGKTDLSFDVSNEPVGEIPYRFDISGNLYEARYEDARLPFPLTDVAANVHVNSAGVQVDNLTAQAGMANLSLTLIRYGWTVDSPLRVEAHARDLQVNRQMVQVLPPEIIAIWSRYQPTGLLDADVTLVFDGTNWTPQLAFGCQDVAFRHEEFPYPLTSATGTITLKDDVLTFALRGLAGTQGVQLSGRVEHPREAPLGWMEFASDGPIPIDGQLLAALDTQKLRGGRKVLQSLAASGNVAFSGRFERLKADQEGFNEHVLLRITGGSVAHEKFPYPITRISGEAELWNGQWTFRDFQGRNDSGRVACSGSFMTNGDDGPLLALDFVATDLPLEDELKAAFSPAMQTAWANLRPRGSVDHVALQLRCRPQTDQCDITVVAQELPERPDGSGQSISLFPRCFPYRLNQVQGELRWHDGYLSMRSLKAEHGGATISTSGFCAAAADGGWRLRFHGMHGEGLMMDRDLMSALPAELSAGVAKLNMTGPLTLTGGFEVRRGAQAEGELSADWDMTLDLENGQMQCGVPLKNIHGSIRLIGAKSPEGVYSRGELAIDSLMCEGVQFTGISGPVWIDPTRVSLGAWAVQPQPNEQPRRLAASVLGGRLAGDIHVALDGVKRFTLQSQLDGLDLSQFARDYLPRERKITGDASGTLRLSGDERGRDTLRGDGHLWLRNADLYELPVTTKLLKILQIKPQSKNSFNASDVDFRITGEDVYLDRIVLKSDTVTLKGAGELNLDRQVGVKLYTLVGDESRRVPVVWPLLAETSRRFLMIEVTGTLDEPVTTRHVLPGLNGTIQQLFPEELGLAPGAVAPRPATGGSAGRPLFQR